MIPQAAEKYIYYQEKDIVLLHGDCLEILPLFEPGSIDLVLTDPPYGVGKDKWDAYDDYTNTISNIGNVIKNITNFLFCFSSTRHIDVLIKSIPMRYRWTFIWYASNNMAYGDMGLQKFTPALIFGDGKIHNSAFQDLRNIPIVPEHNGHPTPKPLPLMKYIIDKMEHCKTILDPFLGSGTTAVAAKQLGRKCIGIEIEKKYLDIAIERLRQEVLF